MNDVLVLLFSAGAAAFLSAVVKGLSSLHSQRAESEEAIIRRLNESATTAHKEAAIQRRRADRAELARDRLREERDKALEESSRRYRIIIEAGLTDPGEDLDE